MADCKVFKNHIQEMEKTAYFILFIYMFWWLNIPTEKWTSKSVRSCFVFELHGFQMLHVLTGIDPTTPAVAPVIENLCIFWAGHCPNHFLSVIGAGNAAVVSCDTSVKGLCSLGYHEKAVERDWSGQWRLLPVELWIVLLVVLFLYMYI